LSPQGKIIVKHEKYSIATFFLAWHRQEKTSIFPDIAISTNHYNELTFLSTNLYKPHETPLLIIIEFFGQAVTMEEKGGKTNACFIYDSIAYLLYIYYSNYT
jgi:hypothetical protein